MNDYRMRDVRWHREDTVSSPLAEWLRIAPPYLRDELAHRAGTSSQYLANLARAHRENPKVRLALAIVLSANAIRREVKDEMILPVITLASIAKTTRRGR